jgi:transcriptional regulator with XRE-family HTH domain
MKELQERIQLLISTKGMTNAEFAEKIGVHPSIISHISSGRNKPSLDIVNKITEAFKEIRLEWIMKGKGPMTSGAYKLFEDFEVAPDTEKIAETPGENDKPRVSDKAIKTGQPASVKNEEKVAGNTVNEEKRKGFEPIEIESKKVEKKYPHKTPQKAIERIVIFYEDKTFREYYPEG